MNAYNRQNLTGDYGYDIAVDAQGNSYVAGESHWDDSYLVVGKYSPSGESLWIVIEDERQFGQHNRLGITLDRNGDVLVAASVLGDSGQGYWVRKYSPDGSPIWTSVHWLEPPGSNPSSVQPLRIAVDSRNHIYIAGPHRNATTGRDLVLSRFTSSGQHRWTRTYDGPRHENDEARALAVNGARVAIAGYATDQANHEVAAVICYDSSGTLLWDYLHRTNTDYRSYFRDMKVRPDGAFVCAGWSRFYGESQVALFMELGSNGDTSWVRTDTADCAYSVATDQSSNTYVVGENNSALVTWKLSPSGQQLWRRSSFEFDPRQVGAERLAVLTNDQGVYACGMRVQRSDRTNFLAVRYDAAGQLQWHAFGDTTGQFLETPMAAAVDALNNLYVTGYGGWPYDDMLTAKFRATGGIEERGAPPVPRAALRVTPTVAATGCELRLANVVRPVKLRIADLTGRTVAELPVARPGTSVRWNLTDAYGGLVSNGVYFAVADLPGARATARFIVQR